MASKDLLKKDVSKIYNVTPFTSDQALFEISNIKSNINKQILSAVKSSSIDCALHSRAGDDDDVVCVLLDDIDVRAVDEYDRLCRHDLLLVKSIDILHSELAENKKKPTTAVLH
jgi:hypothetical protein